MRIVAIVGSPSPEPRWAGLFAYVQSCLQPAARGVRVVVLRELPADALLLARVDDPSIRHAVEAVAAADVVIVATPICKAAYSGILKAFLDLAPADALRGKTVLPLASGASLAHLLAFEYALRPVLSALGARDILDPVFISDSQLHPHDGPDDGPVHARHLPPRSVRERMARSLKPLLDRAQGLSRRDDAVRTCDALLARLQPAALQEMP